MTHGGPEVPRSQAIDREVRAWPGVTGHTHRFGGTEYRLGRREIGHIHGDWLADVPLPRRLRDPLVASGRARPHHVLPDSGWVSIPIESPEGTEQALAALRLSFDLATRQRENRRGS